MATAEEAAAIAQLRRTLRGDCGMGSGRAVKFSSTHNQNLEHLECKKKERKKTDNPREGWEDGTPPPHRDFKKRGVVR